LDLRGRKWQVVGEDRIMRSFINVHFTIYYEGDQIKEDGINGVCSTHEVGEKCIQNFGRKM